MRFEKSDIKRILCIKPRGIGDIILSTIILENLKSAIPHSVIHFLTEKFARRAVENNPFVDRVLSYNKNDFIFKTIRMIRKEKYDLVFDLYGNPKTAQLTFTSGAKYKVGFPHRGRNYAYNIFAEEYGNENHAAEKNLQFIKAIDVPVISKELSFSLTEDEKSFADNFFNQHFKNQKIIGIIPSGGWVSKRCDAVKWIEICNSLHKEFNAKFLIIWGPGDEDDANEIYNSTKEISLLAPATNVGISSALISLCNLVIANDSGPMHIAAALKVPTIGIFGPTDPKNHKPYNENSDYIIKSDLFCIICNKLVCPYHHECMIELPVDILIEKSRKLIN